MPDRGQKAKLCAQRRERITGVALDQLEAPVDPSGFVTHEKRRPEPAFTENTLDAIPMGEEPGVLSH